MTYIASGRGIVDYLPCRYGESKLLFRGPKKDLSEPYIAFIGSTETYGKFIQTPFPALVEDAVGMPCVNFGQNTKERVMHDAPLQKGTERRTVHLIHVKQPFPQTVIFFPHEQKGQSDGGHARFLRRR